MLIVQLEQVLIQQIPLELVLDGPGHEPAEPAVTNVGLHPCGEGLLDTDRPLRHSHELILPQ